LLHKALLVSVLFGWLSGCAHNDLLMGRVEDKVAGHKVVVMDCYRTSVPAPEPEQWTPCKDADVKIHAGELVVNGQSYGQIGPNDEVLVDHGKVSISRK
jgi:hypothetical protein